MVLCGLVHDMSIPPGIALSCPNHQSIRPIELSAANDTKKRIEFEVHEINFLSATQLGKRLTMSVAKRRSLCWLNVIEIVNLSTVSETSLTSIYDF